MSMHAEICFFERGMIIPCQEISSNVDQLFLTEVSLVYSKCRLKSNYVISILGMEIWHIT